MSFIIEINENADEIPSDEVLKNEEHCLDVTVNSKNNYVNLNFSSREAMREFAKNLLHESYYGSGSIELFPLGDDNSMLVTNGARLTESSARIFVEYHEKKQLNSQKITGVKPITLPY